MNCINLKYRTKKGKIYKYCTKYRKSSIEYPNLCDNCPFKQFKTYRPLFHTPLKTYSKKRAKIEKKRYSILTSNLDKCYFCENIKCDIHEIYAGSRRTISMKNGFCIPICRYHHDMIQNDNDKMLALKQKCQREFEKTHTREDFMNITKKNYLED